MPDPFELAAAQWEQSHRRWSTPGALAAHLDPSTKRTPALDAIDRKLVDLYRGEGKRRLMVFMPPQEGKSQRISRRFPEWILTENPHARIGIVSYETELAKRWGRVIKNDAAQHLDLPIRLQADSKAAGRWNTVQGGGVYCVGLNGAITGQPIDVMLIDDPVKGRAEAESEVYRERAWQWWENNGFTRMSNGLVVLMMTRWHEDDLAGRLLTKEPGEWDVLSIPAIAGANDPLGRAEGDELVSATKDPGFFYRTRELRSKYVWDSVYQQSPSAATGSMFKRSDWRYWRRLGKDAIDLDGVLLRLNECTKFITMDLAASTKTSADYTVASVWAIGFTGDLVLLDRARARVPDSAHFDLVRPLVARWFSPYDVVYVESRMFGTTFVYAAGRSGIPIRELQADKDKVTRASSGADMQRQGRIWLPRDAVWLDEWLDEHAEFPTGKHDDQVDTTGYAARVALAHWVDPSPPVAPPRQTMYGDNALDFLSIPV